jgi:hypothetical protein
MREGEDVGRQHRVGDGQPEAGIGLAIIGDDQVEIEHQPIQLALPEAGAVEQDRPRGAGIQAGDRGGHRRGAWIDWPRQLGGDQVVKGRICSQHGSPSGVQPLYRREPNPFALILSRKGRTFRDSTRIARRAEL